MILYKGMRKPRERQIALLAGYFIKRFKKAIALGIGEATLYRKLKIYQIQNSVKSQK